MGQKDMTKGVGERLEGKGRGRERKSHSLTPTISPWVRQTAIAYHRLNVYSQLTDGRSEIGIFSPVCYNLFNVFHIH